MGPHLFWLAPSALVFILPGPCRPPLAPTSPPSSPSLCVCPLQPSVVLAGPHLCWLCLGLSVLVCALPHYACLCTIIHLCLHLAVHAHAHSCWSAAAIAPTPAAAISPPTFHPPLCPCSFTHSFVLAPATWSHLLGLCLAFVHAHFVPTGLFGLCLGSFVLICAIWGMGGALCVLPSLLFISTSNIMKLVNT